MVGGEKELRIRFVPGCCQLVEVRGAGGGLGGALPAPGGAGRRGAASCRRLGRDGLLAAPGGVLRAAPGAGARGLARHS